MPHFTLSALIVLALVVYASAERLERGSRKLNLKKNVELPCTPLCKCLPGGCDSGLVGAVKSCKGKDGVYTIKQRTKKVEQENCGWATGHSVCKTIWGKRQIDDELLGLGDDAVLACMGCSGRCGACARTSLVKGLVAEILEQIATITVEVIRSLHAEDTEFSKKLRDGAADFLGDTVENVMAALMSGAFSVDFMNTCVPGVSGFDIGVRTGVAHYSSEKCVCWFCVTKFKGVRPWVSWYIKKKESC